MVLFRKKRHSESAERIIQLTIVEGNNDTGDRPGKVFNLQSGENFIGRDPLCEVVINSGTVSRKHANLRVSYDQTSFTIADLGSTNGVIIEPSIVLRNAKQPLSSGDEFQIGEIVLKFLVLDQDETRGSHGTLSVDDLQSLGDAVRQQLGNDGSELKPDR